MPDDSAMQNAGTETYIQVGFTAARDPITGEFLPAVPLYILADDQAKRSAARLQEDLGQLFAMRMKQYIDENRKAGLKI